MNPLPKSKATWVAALILGAILASIAVRPSRASEPFWLDRIAVAQFSLAPDNQLQVRRGVLTVDQGVYWRNSFNVPRPANLVPEALDRTLISAEAWLAYYNLGLYALVGFELLEGAQKFWFGDDAYYAVAPSPDTLLTNGALTNLSTRAQLPPGGTTVIAGFVIQDRPRAVLLRAVGPTLRKFGIGSYIGNPRLKVTREGRTILANDDWSSGPDAAAIRSAAVRVGAFALDEGSRDAASLVILGPGAYSVQVESAEANGATGEVLVEIYTIPDDFDFASAAAP